MTNESRDVGQTNSANSFSLHDLQLSSLAEGITFGEVIAHSESLGIETFVYNKFFNVARAPAYRLLVACNVGIAFHISQDIAQDVLIEVNDEPFVKLGASPFALLRTVALRRTIDYLRQKRAHREIPLDETKLAQTCAGGDSDDKFAKRELEKLCTQFLDNQKSELKKDLLRQAFTGRPKDSEIANIHQRSVNAIRVTRSRLKVELRKFLDQNGVQTPRPRKRKRNK